MNRFVYGCRVHSCELVSWHGISINFQKEVTVFLEGDPASGCNSRIYNRCKDFGLVDRICIVRERNASKQNRIDYMDVSYILEKRKRAPFLG